MGPGWCGGGVGRDGGGEGEEWCRAGVVRGRSRAGQDEEWCGEGWGGLVRLLATAGAAGQAVFAAAGAAVRPACAAAGGAGPADLHGGGAGRDASGRVRRGDGDPFTRGDGDLCDLMHARVADRLRISHRQDLFSHVSRARGRAVTGTGFPTTVAARRPGSPPSSSVDSPPRTASTPPPHAPPRCGPRRFRPPLAPPRRRLPPPPARARRRDRDLRRGDRDSDCQWGVAGSGSWQRQHRRRPTRPPGTPPAETVHG